MKDAVCGRLGRAAGDGGRGRGPVAVYAPKDLGAYTFATIFFNKTYNDPNRKRKIKRAIMIAIPIILVLVVVAVILAVYFHNRQKKIDSMEQSFYDTIEYIQRITTPGQGGVPKGAGSRGGPERQGNSGGRRKLYEAHRERDRGG